MQTVLNTLRSVFLTLLYVILVIPYGIDAPSTNKIKECSLDKGAITCELTENGYEAAFSMRLERCYRPLLTKHAFDDFDIKVFKMDDSYDPDPEEVAFYRIVDDEKIPAVNADFAFEVENDPYLVHDHAEFTGIVHVTFPQGTPSGAYSLAMAFDVYNEFVYQYILIVP